MPGNVFGLSAAQVVPNVVKRFLRSRCSLDKLVFLELGGKLLDVALAVRLAELHDTFLVQGLKQLLHEGLQLLLCLLAFKILLFLVFVNEIVKFDGRLV